MTSDRQNIEIELALRELRSARRQLQPVGTCYFCEGNVSEAQLFCDKDCAKDWEKRRGNK